jgi:hypothetical protein
VNSVEDHEERKDFSSRQWHELCSDSVHHGDDGVLAGPAWVTCWSAQGEGWPGLAGLSRWVSAQHSFGIKKLSFNFPIFY